jgi:thymidylate synthase (FAD)
VEIITASAELLGAIDGVDMLRHIERCGRVCYKSEWRITEDSYGLFVKKIIANGHEAVLEHASVTARIVCDRGVSHEIVRHRLASYCQESTRYVDYAGERVSMQVICPAGLGPEEFTLWRDAMLAAENAYMELRRRGVSPQIARSALPNALKTELMMTANLREWRHFFRLRLSPAAHPQMREVAALVLEAMRAKIPLVFDEF